MMELRFRLAVCLCVLACLCVLSDVLHIPLCFDHTFHYWDIFRNTFRDAVQQLFRKVFQDVFREMFREVFRNVIIEVIQHTFVPTSHSENFSSFSLVL